MNCSRLFFSPSLYLYLPLCLDLAICFCLDSFLRYFPLFCCLIRSRPSFLLFLSSESSFFFCLSLSLSLSLSISLLFSPFFGGGCGGGRCAFLLARSHVLSLSLSTCALSSFKRNSELAARQKALDERIRRLEVATCMWQRLLKYPNHSLLRFSQT